MSKNPLSGFAPKQTIESSALAAYPHSATQGRLTSLQLTEADEDYDDDDNNNGGGDVSH